MNKLETIKFIDGELSMEIKVSLEDDTVWMSTAEIAKLFEMSQRQISRYIYDILQNDNYEKAESSEKNVNGRLDTNYKSIILPVTKDNGKTYDIPHYNMDVILEIGKRIKSNRGELLKQLFGDYKNNIQEETTQIVIYNNGSSFIQLDMSIKDQTIWATQEKIAELFDTTQANVSMHIKNILEEGELEDGSIYKDFLYVPLKKRNYVTTIYNLDMILAVGFRVKSNKAILFRRWAYKILESYIKNGYVVDENRYSHAMSLIIELMEGMKNINSRLSTVEKKTKEKDDFVFEEDDYMTPLVKLEQIISTSNESIVLIDPYVDSQTLQLFSYKKKEVALLVITSTNSKLNQRDVDVANGAYKNITIDLNDKYHDRYLIIDKEVFYHLGTSINRIGSKFTQMSKISDEDVIEILKRRIS